MLNRACAAGLASLLFWPAVCFSDTTVNKEAMSPEQRLRYEAALQEQLVIAAEKKAVDDKVALAEANRLLQLKVKESAVAARDASIARLKQEREEASDSILIMSAIAYRVSDPSLRCNAMPYFRYHCEGLHSCTNAGAEAKTALTEANVCRLPGTAADNGAAFFIEVKHLCGPSERGPTLFRDGVSFYLDCYGP
jgi:hypothetical protein